MSEINTDKEKSTLSGNEYTKGVTYNGKSIKSSTHTEINNEATKAKSYCPRCFDLAHINPDDCKRKCNLCLGNHWTKECTSFNRCPWCGKSKGPHICDEINLSPLFITCPICKLIGHCANKCSPLFIALSQEFGPLKDKLLRRRYGRRRRKPFIRRVRKY